jgi:CRP/FNR family transcriptional regulator
MAYPPGATASPHDLKVWHLSQIDILAERCVQDIEYISSVCHMEKIPRNQVIYLPGDPANTVYFLKEGRVRISRLSPEGKQITLLVLEGGTFFGEVALLEQDSNHENIAETMEDSFLCYTSRENFENLLHKNPDLSLKIVKLFGFRMRRIENRIEDIAFLPIQARLRKLLQQLARDYGKPTTDGILLDIKLTHQDLGQLIHATRQTVTEMLNAFEAEALIRTERRKIILLAPLLARAA